MTTVSVPHIPGKRSIEEAGRFFRYMADFVGFGKEDAEAIRKSSLIVEKHLPTIIGNFYSNLLQYPQTRKFFLKSDGTVDQEYLQLRMYHQANFWRRTAGGVYDDEYAGFVDYVGRAHTSRGADKNIFIEEQFVIGMVGFVQHAIISALIQELHEYNDDLERQAIKAWNKICMVLLEILARAYREEREEESLPDTLPVDSQAVFEMSVESYEKSLGLLREPEYEYLEVGSVNDIPEGQRKIVELNGLSIGVFHHKGNWYAIQNRCLHRGGPVATGKLVDDNIICPWHGYTYDVTNGRLLIDPSASLDMYPVSIQDDIVIIRVPVWMKQPATASETEAEQPVEEIHKIIQQKLADNEFFLKDIPPGRIRLVQFKGYRVAVYNVNGNYYATAEECTHAGGPLSEGDLEGEVVTCPWHDSCFNVTTGAVVCPPADEPLQTYEIQIVDEIGRILSGD
jgi:nitrite reductase/ring-hydroxylating ferredoxin subunit/hemoglobin-like flavoprotein